MKEKIKKALCITLAGIGGIYAGSMTCLLARERKKVKMLEREKNSMIEKNDNLECEF